MRRTPLLICFVLGLATVLVAGGCRQKKRLTGSDFDFRISPAAATAVKGSTVTLTALAGGGDINPTWTVSGVGTLSANIGRTVDFSSDDLGDTVITATYDGVATNAQIAVVSFLPSGGNTFNVYTDDGLPTMSPTGTSLVSDIGIFPGASQTLTELSTGYTPEGIKYLRSENGDTNDVLFITVDKNNTGATADLSSFSAGRIKFNLRLPVVLGAFDNIQVEIDDNLGVPPGLRVQLSDAHGLERLSTDWQEISIPVGSFAGTSLTGVKTPFAIVWQNTATSRTLDVDAIRWEK